MTDIFGCIVALVSVIYEAAGALLAITVSYYLIRYLPMSARAWERWISTIVSEHARQVVTAEAHTTAGMIETKIAQGSMKWVDLRVDNPIIMAHAERALARVPHAMIVETRKDPRSMAETVLGMVRTNSVLPTIVGNALAASAKDDAGNIDPAKLSAIAIPLVVGSSSDC
jgi:hypothetical protein